MVANSFGKESKANSNPESHNFDIFNCVLFLIKSTKHISRDVLSPLINLASVLDYDLLVSN